MREGEVIFNNNSSLDLNLFLEDYPSINIASEEFEEVPVEGRSGNLIVNKGTFENKRMPFEFTILSENIEIDFDRVYEWLTEIQDNRLIFGEDNRCYTVEKVVLGDIKKEFRSIGGFAVTFICEPFLKDIYPTTHEIASSGFSFYYQGNAPGESLIKIYGNGNIQFAINGETMTIDGINSYVEIDTSLMQVRNGDGTPKDEDSNGDFVLFDKGLNSITYSGSITKIIIEYTTQYRK